MSPNINFRITFIHLFNFVLKTLLKLQQSDAAANHPYHRCADATANHLYHRSADAAANHLYHRCADAAANHLYHRCADAAFPDGHIIIPSLKSLRGFIHIFMKTVGKMFYATTFMRKYKVKVYNTCVILYAV